MSRHGPKSASFRELDDIMYRWRLEMLADKAKEVMERDTCKNCGAAVIGAIADAGLVIEYAGFKFCCDACVENWVDAQIDKAQEDGR